MLKAGATSYFFVFPTVQTAVLVLLQAKRVGFGGIYSLQLSFVLKKYIGVPHCIVFTKFKFETQ